MSLIGSGCRRVGYNYYMVVMLLRFSGVFVSVKLQFRAGATVVLVGRNTVR
jgi:hypothetical protein